MQAAYNERKQVKKQYYQEHQQKSVHEKIKKLENEINNCENQKQAEFAKLKKERNERDVLKE